MDAERIATLKKLLEMDPDDTFSRYALGLEHRQDEPALALEHLGEVVRRDPLYVPAYFMAGLIHTDGGNIGEARRWLERGIATARQVGDDHALGEMEEALDQL